MTTRVLGQDYELSLVFVDSARSRNLNRVWRGKNQPANILSFPLTPTAGEIFIDLEMVGKKNLLFIFIHGLLHLKGLDHGSKMEALESQLVKYFQTYEQTDRHRS
ncbi:MAG: rRNA maturation RNase YbeY [Patescibacteria group bacterium]